MIVLRIRLSRIQAQTRKRSILVEVGEARNIVGTIDRELAGDMDEKKESGIVMGVEKKEHAGSCNSCQSPSSEFVAVVYLHTITFRLCNDCAKKVSKLLERKF